jgi:3-oxoacyl-[acyl-carrier-protein] synthase III
MNSSITQIASYLPKVSRSVTLPGGDNGTPRIEKESTLSEICIAAIKNLKDTSIFHPDNNGAIIVASASMPVDHNESIASRIQYEFGLPTSTLAYQLTGGCYISLQAIQLGKDILNSNKQLDYILVVTGDKFSHLVSEKTSKLRPSSSMWSDGASALIIERGTHGFNIDNFHSEVDGSSWYDCKLKADKQGQLAWTFADEQSNLYASDQDDALQVIHQSLTKAKIKSADLKGFVVINRSRGFAKKIINALHRPDLTVYESFLDIGHAGCADLIVNIEKMVNSNKMLGKFLVYTCGYGYVRSSAIINIH